MITINWGAQFLVEGGGGTSPVVTCLACLEKREEEGANHFLGKQFFPGAAPCGYVPKLYGFTLAIMFVMISSGERAMMRQ